MMYAYKEKASETSIGSHNLRDVLECCKIEEGDSMFLVVRVYFCWTLIKQRLKFKEGEFKVLRFKADSDEKRDQWIQAINFAKELLDPTAAVEIKSADVQLFKDVISSTLTLNN